MELERYLEMSEEDDSPRESSKDCLELMHLALEIGDEQWFQELSEKRNRKLANEKVMREELGLTEEWT